jgi:hypothetical protein
LEVEIQGRGQGDQVNLGITILNSEAEDEHGHLRFKGKDIKGIK